MVESCAPSGCRACSVRSPCTCRSRTVGILEITGIQAPVRGLLSGARTICSIPSGKSQYVEGGVIFAAWWSRQCSFKLSILTHVGHTHTRNNFVFFLFPSVTIPSLFILPRTSKGYREGIGAEEKRGKKNYSWYSAQGPGRMAQTPQAGTGDSVS